MKVTIEQARQLLHEGKFVKNDRFGRNPEEGEYCWSAKYIVHFRPAHTECAVVEQI